MPPMLIRRATKPHARGRLVREGYIGIDRYALRQMLGYDLVERFRQRGQRGRRAQVLREGMAGVNPGAMWALMANKEYGSSVDAPAIATREALQNSRDAIDAAAGLLGAAKLPPGGAPWIGKNEGRFEVTCGSGDDLEPRDYGDGMRWIRWVDNGVGMSSDVVFDKFLNLGDTTKTSGGEAGGFGVAKAIILGISTTFRWTLHSRGSVFEANGFHAPVREYEADSYRKGTSLIVHDIDPKYDYYWETTFGTEPMWRNRQEVVLGSNNLSPQRGHAGVRLFYQGREVQAALRGRGALLVDRVDTAPKTKVSLRAYKRPDVGRLYVRLAGLLQYSERLRSQKAAFDLVVDVFTRMAPGDDGYPLTTSRTKLDGPTADKVDAYVAEVLSETLSATKEATDTKSFDLREGSDEDVEAGLDAAMTRYSHMLADRAIVRRLKLVDGTGNLLRRMQFEYQLLAQKHEALLAGRAERRRVEAQNAERRKEEAAERTWWDRPTPSTEEPPTRRPAPSQKLTDTGMSIQAMQRLAVKRQKRRGGVRQNPFVGFAALHVDETQFNARRLRPYFSNPDRWIDLALVWRLTCRLVLDESARKDTEFDVGFVFQDNTLAMFERKAGVPTPIIYLNPDWFNRSVMRAFRDRPLSVAAVLHSKACHEIAHIEYSGKYGHDEGFVSHREALADETVSVLYPLGGVVENMLGIKPAPTPEARELARLRAKLEALKKGRRAPMRQACPEALAIRRRLLVPPRRR